MDGLFLAQVIGIYLLVVGLTMLIHPARLNEALSEFAKNKALMLLNGVISLIIGLLIVCSHNVWDSVWEGLISLLGWIVLIGGALRLLIPSWGEKWASCISGKTFFIVAGIIALILGLYLSYVGFFFSEILVIEV